jgi:uncharacterized protein YndB with AHSA1/START domain
MNPNEQYARRTAQGEVAFARLLPGPIERVWTYFSDSEKRGRWLASGPMEERPGGKIEFHFRQGDLSAEKTPPPAFAHLANGIQWTGIVTRHQPPDALGFTWEAGENRSEVVVRLTPEDRMVRLVLKHRRLASLAAERNAAGGWHLHLDLLLAVLEGTDPPPYWTELKRLKSEYAQLFVDA